MIPNMLDLTQTKYLQLKTHRITSKKGTNITFHWLSAQITQSINQKCNVLAGSDLMTRITAFFVLKSNENL